MKTKKSRKITSLFGAGLLALTGVSTLAVGLGSCSSKPTPTPTPAPEPTPPNPTPVEKEIVINEFKYERVIVDPKASDGTIQMIPDIDIDNHDHTVICEFEIIGYINVDESKVSLNEFTGVVTINDSDLKEGVSGVNVKLTVSKEGYETKEVSTDAYVEILPVDQEFFADNFNVGVNQTDITIQKYQFHDQELAEISFENNTEDYFTGIDIQYEIADITGDTAWTKEQLENALKVDLKNNTVMLNSDICWKPCQFKFNIAWKIRPIINDKIVEEYDPYFAITSFQVTVKERTQESIPSEPLTLDTSYGGYNTEKQQMCNDGYSVQCNTAQSKHWGYQMFQNLQNYPNWTQDSNLGWETATGQPFGPGNVGASVFLTVPKSTVLMSYALSVADATTDPRPSGSNVKANWITTQPTAWKVYGYQNGSDRAILLDERLIPQANWKMATQGFVNTSNYVITNPQIVPVDKIQIVVSKNAGSSSYTRIVGLNYKGFELER